jgi:hypothetical protein
MEPRDYQKVLTAKRPRPPLETSIARDLELEKLQRGKITLALFRQRVRRWCKQYREIRLATLRRDEDDQRRRDEADCE